MKHTTRFLAGLIAAGCSFAAGCGDDETTDGDSASNTSDGGASVVVGVDSLHFDADDYTAAAGSIELDLVNDGSLAHTLVIEGRESDLQLAVEGPTRSDTGRIELDAGTYTIYCDVPGHRGSGMESELVVE